MSSIPLSAALGEVMAPGTLVTALMLSPEGMITVDAGALHGRSALEQSLQWAQRREELIDPQAYWMVWVAIELDHAQRPFRYKGLSVSQLWVDGARQRGYKVLAESVNRISDALMGRVNVKTLSAKEKKVIERQLKTISNDLWECAPESFKRGLF